MKILMIIFLAGFLLFGAIGLYFRLTHDWNQLAVESDKLGENSIAKRDGRAMQMFGDHKPDEASIAEAKTKADKQFRRQVIFSVLSVACLACTIVCGALLQR